MVTVAKLQENTADACKVYLENLMLKVWQQRILFLSEQHKSPTAYLHVEPDNSINSGGSMSEKRVYAIELPLLPIRNLTLCRRSADCFI